MNVMLLVGVGLLVLFFLLIFLPKRKKADAVAQVVPQYVPQYAPQYQQPAPAPQPVMSLRQQEVREKVMALTSHYLELDEAKFRKNVVDEAVLLLSQGKQ